VTRASHLLHTRWRRSGRTQGRSEPPVVVSGLPLHELRMLVTMSGLINGGKIATWLAILQNKILICLAILQNKILTYLAIL
jgi:hypothetical protein